MKMAKVMCLPSKDFHGEMTISLWSVDLGVMANSTAGLTIPANA